MNHVRNNLSNSKKITNKFKISNVAKKLITIFVFTYLTFFPTQISFALTAKTTPTASPTPTATNLQQQVDLLKSKIASKVAELNLVEKRGIYGTVTDATDSQITLKNVNGLNRFIDVDELTKFESSSSKSFGISDIKTGMVLSALGLYNKESQRLQARVIIEDSSLPNYIYGAVIAKDNVNFILTVGKENGAKNLVDIESVTKTYTFANNTLSKSGFTKIQIGQPLVVIGFLDKQNKNKILASRIFLFPEITANSKINLDPNQPTIVPATGSGRKLTPIVR